MRIFYYLYAVEEITRKLNPYLPTGTAPIIADWIKQTGCQFRISRSRVSKFGDYRAPYNGSGHKISVNNDLNPYAFLVTTVHEFAHLKTWNEHKHRVKPHGVAWKSNFKLLMQPFFKKKVFPDDIHHAIVHYMQNPAASSCTDMNLFKKLRAYDPQRTNQFLLIEQLPDGQHFVYKGKRIFKKIKKIRKRYHCIEITSQKTYLFSPIAEIQPLNDNFETANEIRNLQTQ